MRVHRIHDLESQRLHNTEHKGDYDTYGVRTLQKKPLHNNHIQSHNSNTAHQTRAPRQAIPLEANETNTDPHKFTRVSLNSNIN